MKGCHLGTAQLCLPAHDWALEIQSGLEEGLLGPSCSPSNWQDSYCGGVTVYSGVATTELCKGH